MSARLIRYTLDGIKLTHDISFGVTDGDGFDVYINRAKLDKGLDYDVSGSVDELRKGDGKITLKAAHAASDVLLILSDTLARRVTNFAKAARFEEAEIDNEFDNLLRLLEDAALNLQSTPYFSPPDIGLVNGELPPLIAGGVLRVNEHKNGFELVELDKVPEFQEALRKATEQADRSESEAGKSEASAQEAQGIADSMGRYRGLWPDTGGSAKKGDTWQTQAGGKPTGKYYTALKDTALAPVGDNQNWRESVTKSSLAGLTDIVFTSSGGKSAIENMIDELKLNPIMYAVGSIMKTGGTTWKYKDSTGQITLSNFRAFNARCLLDFVSGGDAEDNYSPAIQRMLDSLEQYSQDTQNSGAFQEKIELYFPDGDYLMKSPVIKKYRNFMRFTGTGRLKAHAAFSGGDYLMELIACSHIEVDGLQFDGNNYAAKSAMRVSGDGFTGTKRNSTNIHWNDCFFYNFGATGTNGYVVDTLSPNGVAGDYSIDDSGFNNCIFLGSYGGAIRLASSEIKINGGKFSFIGVDGVNPVISLGNGTSLIMSGVVFTTCSSEHLGADDGASIGRVSLTGCYSETTTKPLYSQSGGTCRSLEINGGYFSAPTNSDATFILFSGNCKGQLSMSGASFQRNGYKWIDLGDSGSYIGDVQTSTTSWLSYYPKVKNGTFTERKIAIQTTQDGDAKRLLDVKYDRSNNNKLQLFVGLIDDFTRLRFLTLMDALMYVDQSGYTECEVQVPAGVHNINKSFAFSGGVSIVCAGRDKTTLNITKDINIRGGSFRIQSASLSYTDRVIKNKNGLVELFGCNFTAATNSIFLVEHHSGVTSIISGDFLVGGSGVILDNELISSGVVTYNATNFTNTSAVACASSTALCRVKVVSDSAPANGFWPRGAIQEDSEVNAGGVVQRINVTAGSSGDWKAIITAAI
ncbi:coil containing protein [Vibrio phage 1.254.O._10N.286.45.C8]|nr:coil containing protein [Vibrio phage 1.254.O._10N.286.45.C8]